MAHRKREEILRTQASLRVPAGRPLRLPGDVDPSDTGTIASKRRGKALLARAVREISEYQRRLAAEERHGVLFLIQALDAGGKDGTIRHVLSGVNPAGVSVHSFKEPTEAELAHDYLWRYEQHAPGPGEIAVFNRSHYEEVLVVRVHPQLLGAEHSRRRGEAVWEQRYREINRWEQGLVGRGIHLVKVLLVISYEEQRIRFLRRCDLPEKNWKFSAADIREREHWDEYQAAFSEMVTHTSTAWAPWHVVPADHKWFARVAAAGALLDALMAIDPQIPRLDPEERAKLDDARAELEAEAPRGTPADPVAADPDRYR